MDTPRSVWRRGLKRRDALRLALLAPAAGLAAGCGPEPPPLIETDDSIGAGLPRGADLQALLDRRAQAQLDGDEEAYLADLDQANTELVERERMVFANLRQFPVETLQFIVMANQPEPDGTGALAEEATGPFRFLPVVKVVKLTADSGPEGVVGPGESFEYTVEKRDDALVVTGVRPLTRNDLATMTSFDVPLLEDTVPPATTPWNLHPLHVINAGNVWLAADDSVSDLDRYAAVAEAEAQRVEEMWGDRPRFPGYVMFFSRDPEKIKAWFELAETRPFDSFAGVALARPGVRRTGELYRDQHSSARMVINLPVAEQFNNDPTHTMRHELVHAVTARGFGTGDQLADPAAWAVEGFADYFETRSVSGGKQQQLRLAAQAFSGSLPVSENFYDGGPDRVRGNYALSSAVFYYIDETRDFETSVDFYEQVIQYTDQIWGEGSESFVNTPAFDGICQNLLGMSAGDLLSGWAGYVQGGA